MAGIGRNLNMMSSSPSPRRPPADQIAHTGNGGDRHGAWSQKEIGIPAWARQEMIRPRRQLQPEVPSEKANSMPVLLTVAAFAQRLGLSQKTVRRIIQKGQLRTIRIGRSIRISESEYARLISRGRL